MHAPGQNTNIVTSSTTLPRVEVKRIRPEFDYSESKRFFAWCFRGFLKQRVQIASTMVAHFPERPRNRPTMVDYGSTRRALLELF